MPVSPVDAGPCAMAPKRDRPLRVVPTPAPAAAPAATNKTPARKTPKRTPQTPMEQAAAEEVYKVDRITAMRWSKGARQYQVLWEGWAEKDATWEPMEHLVGCAAQIREYEQRQEAEDKKAKEEILKKRQEKKDKEEAERIARRAAAAQALIDNDVVGGAEDQAEEGADEDSAGRLHVHKGKRGAVWHGFRPLSRQAHVLTHEEWHQGYCVWRLPLSCRWNYKLLGPPLDPPQA